MGMLLFICLNIGLVLLIPILGMLVKDLIVYIRYFMKYKRQGIHFQYFPIKGMLAYLKPKEGGNWGEGLIKLLNNDLKSKDLVLINGFLGPNDIIVLNSLDLAKEFFIKEVDCCRRENFTNFKIGTGFFMKGGKKALIERGIFTEFFQHDKLKLLIPGLLVIIKREIAELKSKIEQMEKDKDGYVAYKLDDFLAKVYGDITTEILFGSKDFPIINGETFNNAAVQALSFNFKVMRNPLNILTFGLASKLGLIKAQTQYDKLVESISESVIEIIKRRREQKGGRNGR